MNDNIQNTKELIISYFNNDKDCFPFSIVANKPEGVIPVLINWKHQVSNCTTKTSKVSIALIDRDSNYSDYTNSIISLIKDKQITIIDARAYSFYEEGCVDFGDVYQTFLLNSTCKYVYFDLLKE